MERRNRNVLYAVLGALVVVMLIAYGGYEAMNQDQRAQEAGASTQATDPGSIQDHQPSGRPSTPALQETNVPPADSSR
jgi:uncharacterized membrane protein YebE (DUF533 family)